MKYQAPTGESDPNAPYIGRNIAAGIQGSRIPPKAVEHPQRELAALITKSGLTASDSDLTQVAQAVRSQRLNYVSAGGTANAITITLDPTPAAWADLIGVPLRIMTGGATNTGAVTLNPNGLGAKALAFAGNVGLTGGELGPSTIFECVYNGSYVQILDIGYLAIRQLASQVGRTQIYATPGAYTFTVPPGVTSVEVEVIGAGGGGGASSAGGGSAAPAGNAGAGGHGGGYAYKRITGLTPGQNISVVVGAGGTGNASAGGSNGGSSSFGAYCSAGGGGGGLYGGNSNNITGTPGNGSGGDLNILGGYGGPSTPATGAYSESNILYVYSRGGIGAGGRGGLHFHGTGQNGIGFGSGGGGASGGVGLPGGAGAPGLVIVRW